MHRKNKIKVILCGGGTGGHIFPMISIANELKNENKENEILFVGSRDRMEMEIVPKHNFKIIGLWISGIKRSSILLNILFAGIPFFFTKLFIAIKVVIFNIQINLYPLHIQTRFCNWFWWLFIRTICFYF